MSQPLPTGRFKWLKEDKWDAIFKKKEWLKKDEWCVILKKKEGIGYFIECDLEYPEELHDLHNDYPLAPEKLIVEDDWLSPYCKELKKRIWFSK